MVGLVRARPIVEQPIISFGNLSVRPALDKCQVPPHPDLLRRYAKSLYDAAVSAVEGGSIHGLDLIVEIFPAIYVEARRVKDQVGMDRSHRQLFNLLGDIDLSIARLTARVSDDAKASALRQTLYCALGGLLRIVREAIREQDQDTYFAVLGQLQAHRIRLKSTPMAEQRRLSREDLAGHIDLWRFEIAAYVLTRWARGELMDGSIEHWLAPVQYSFGTLPRLAAALAMAIMADMNGLDGDADRISPRIWAHFDEPTELEDMGLHKPMYDPLRFYVVWGLHELSFNGHDVRCPGSGCDSRKALSPTDRDNVSRGIGSCRTV